VTFSGWLEILLLSALTGAVAGYLAALVGLWAAGGPFRARKITSTLPLVDSPERSVLHDSDDQITDIAHVSWGRRVPRGNSTTRRIRPGGDAGA